MDERSVMALEASVGAAQQGDRAALEYVLREVRPQVAALALRFFGCPDHAQDATQEVMLQILTRLGHFERRSAFRTWVYRVACNKFLSMARSTAERHAMTFEQFDEDLQHGDDAAAPSPEHELALAEIRIGCTLAMLLALPRESRLAYILGEIVELDHQAAAEVLACPAHTYRKRLERSRAQVTELMQRRCGVFGPAGSCQCERRVLTATARGHLVPGRWLFATSTEQVREFPQVLVQIRKLHELQRAAAIYRSHPAPHAREELTAQLLALACGDEGEGRGG